LDGQLIQLDFALAPRPRSVFDRFCCKSLLRLMDAVIHSAENNH
jgi:hypothetical protein